jgi:DNA-binding transcriptional regulator YhcF (GntR family)
MTPDKIEKTSQSIDNLSFDNDYQFSGNLVYTENTAGTAITPQKTIATEAKQDQIITEQQQLQVIQESIQELLSRLDFLPSVRGIAADLRVTMLSGGTVTAVTTVTTVGNQTSIGGWTASIIVPNSMNNTAILSNINNII